MILEMLNKYWGILSYGYFFITHHKIALRFVPGVNIDSYEYIYKTFKTSGVMLEIRKSRRPGGNCQT